MSANAPGAPLKPTFEGYVSSTLDALVLFEACLSGQLNHVPRRPHDRERKDLIKSGSIFIYEEHASGIKRWTDGVSWSPSRILGNFLVYRELKKPFPPGEKKRALKKRKAPSADSISEHIKAEGSSSPDYDFLVDNSIINDGDKSHISRNHNSNNVVSQAHSRAGISKDTERALIGSLVDSYGFKEEDGLVKKTISVSYNGVPHHLVSYYTLEDVICGDLGQPSKSPELMDVRVRPNLIHGQNFRMPVEDGFYVHDESGAPFYITVSGAHELGNGFLPSQYPHGMALANYPGVPQPMSSLPSYSPYTFPPSQQNAAFWPVNGLPANAMAPSSMSTGSQLALPPQQSRATTNPPFPAAGFPSGGIPPGEFPSDGFPPGGVASGGINADVSSSHGINSSPFATGHGSATPITNGIGPVPVTEPNGLPSAHSSLPGGFAGTGAESYEFEADENHSSWFSHLSGSTGNTEPFYSGH